MAPFDLIRTGLDLADPMTNVQRYDSRADDAQVIVPFPPTIEAVRHVRSTLILSSLAVLRERGLQGAYLAELPLAYHGAILEAVAGAWMPIDVGLAHYVACDALGLPTEVQV